MLHTCRQDFFKNKKKDTENNVFQCLFLIFGNFIRSTEPVDVPFVNQLFDLVRQAGS